MSPLSSTVDDQWKSGLTTGLLERRFPFPAAIIREPLMQSVSETLVEVGRRAAADEKEEGLALILEGRVAEEGY